MIKLLIIFFEKKMYSYNDDSSFNLFHSYQGQNEDSRRTDPKKKKISMKNKSSQELNQFHYELNKYEREISVGDGRNKNKENVYYHFEFIGPLSESPEKKHSSEKKVTKHFDLNSINLNNLSLIERKIESNSLYVGFENKYGENSCYINVVIHLLYFFPCINEYLIKLYQNKKDSLNYSNSNITNFNNIDFFLFLLGKTLYEYQSILSNLENRGITILHTTELRKYLDLISNNFYELNKVADPVELLTFLLNIINKNNQIEVHKYFFINLIEEIQCNGYCQKKNIKKYDKDNFIYHIYVDEIMNEINKNHLHFQHYNHNLFKFSRIISLNFFKNCKKCGNQIKRILKCNGPEYPIFLLLNCIWNTQNIEVKKVIKFLYLLSLEDDLNNLFLCIHNNNQRIIYNLLGMILYSSALSHYVNVMFNIQNNKFVLYNDDKIKELNSIHEVYREITVEQIKKNPKAFFYPVLLVYYKEIIYNDNNTIKINDYTIQKYNNLVEECKKAKKEKEIILTEEQKRQNYLEYVKAQMIFDKEQNNYNNYFNDNNNGSGNNNNIGLSSLYKVKEEEHMDEEKDFNKKSSNSSSFKMIIEEDLKGKNDFINNSSNNIININNINNTINEIKQDNKLNKNDNLEKKINIPFNNKYFDDNHFIGIKSYQSGNDILQIQSNKNKNKLFLESESDNDNGVEVKRKNRKHGTDIKNNNHRLKNPDFFSNII